MTAAKQAQRTPEWRIDRQAHGLMLLQDNYCVARLNDGEAEAVRMFNAIDQHDALVARVAELEAALSEVESWTASATLRKVGEPDTFGGEARKACSIARAALAKGQA